LKSAASDEQNIWPGKHLTSEASDERSRQHIWQDDPQFSSHILKTVAFNLETYLKAITSSFPIVSCDFDSSNDRSDWNILWLKLLMKIIKQIFSWHKSDRAISGDVLGREESIMEEQGWQQHWQQRQQR
jgi:hypothetical protein